MENKLLTEIQKRYGIYNNNPAKESYFLRAIFKCND